MRTEVFSESTLDHFIGAALFLFHTISYSVVFVQIFLQV